MQSLSPKNYIQTRARTLPIYKCFVSKDWENVRSAGVIVMRRHNNGNITAGFYYIDLRCLGVKSTSFYFNMDEKELFDTIPRMDLYEEADYALAHNIVFAGHDFAMDFEIGPHKDFEITRHILEEDNDDIPLIEIEVGDKGQPHLIVLKSTDRLDALAKLKKNAGEGNYYYSVAEEQNFNEYFLDNIPIGKLDCLKVLKVETEDLEDDKKVEKRDAIEQIYITAELLTRHLPDEYRQVEWEEDQAWKKNWIAELSYIPLEPMEKFYTEYSRAMDEIISDKTDLSLEDKMIRAVNKYPSNPVVTAMIYEQSILMHREKATPVAKEHAEKLIDKYPVTRISLALGALVQGAADERFNDIYKAESIRDIYPGETTFFMYEFANFGLVKMLQCIEEGDVAFAVKYYNMIANSGGNKCIFTPFVFGKYYNLLMSLDDEDDETN